MTASVRASCELEWETKSCLVLPSMMMSVPFSQTGRSVQRKPYWEVSHAKPMPQAQLLNATPGFFQHGWLRMLLNSWSSLLGFLCQDLSVAGSQSGMAGERSSLIKEVFRLADALPNLPATRNQIFVVMFCRQIFFLMQFNLQTTWLHRRCALLENVKALLSRQDGCRGLFNFIEQAGLWMESFMRNI